MTQPYPWAILSDGLMLIGLHQTKNFSYPAVTYFGLNSEQFHVLLDAQSGKIIDTR
jgi:hypothetical protein